VDRTGVKKKKFITLSSYKLFNLLSVLFLPVYSIKQEISDGQARQLEHENLQEISDVEVKWEIPDKACQSHIAIILQ
jgi:hypothetical protein